MRLRAQKAGQKPILIVLCGPSHVGKTTFAQALGGNFTIISTDEIRKRLSVSFGDQDYESKIWDIYESMKRKALRQGRNVILDACHISPKARWHSLQGLNASYQKICVVFDLPLQTIRARCLKEKRVSLKEVKRMWTDFQANKPSIEELKLQGFDKVYFITECPEYPIERSRPIIVHHLQAGLPIQLGERWFKDKEDKL